MSGGRRRGQRPRVAVLGGTFDHLHVGHRALLDTAFAAADEVGIGVTTETYLREHSKPVPGRIQSYRARRRSLLAHLRRRYRGRRFWLAPLGDGLGRSVDDGIDVLVVTEDTSAGAAAVNRERRRRGLRPLRVVRAPLVRGEDGLVVSSRRIRAGAIDTEGRRRRPLSISVILVGPGLARSRLRPALQDAFDGMRLRVAVRSIPRLGSRRLPGWAAAARTRRAEIGLAVLADTAGRPNAAIDRGEAGGPMAVRPVAGSTTGRLRFPPRLG